MRVVFKMGVIIGWDLVGEPAGAARARRTPSAAELRGKQGWEHACHGIFLAYDYDRKRSQKSGGTGMATRLEVYSVRAYNTAKLSENKMHDDTVAKRFGFSGGLVPGAHGMAYVMHPPVTKWGRAFLQ